MRHEIQTERRLPPMLKIAEIQSELSISRPTVYRLIRDGALKRIKIGRSVRFLQRDVEQLLREHNDLLVEGLTVPRLHVAPGLRLGNDGIDTVGDEDGPVQVPILLGVRRLLPGEQPLHDRDEPANDVRVGIGDEL